MTDSKNNSSQSSETTNVSICTSLEQKERVRKNRERALELRKARNRAQQPYTKPSSASSANTSAVAQVVTHVHSSAPCQSLRDSHAGFIIEEGPVKRAAVCRIITEESGEHTLFVYPSPEQGSLTMPLPYQISCRGKFVSGLANVFS